MWRARPQGTRAPRGSGPQPGARLGRRSATGAGPPLHTKPAGASGGPLVQREAKPPASRPPHPFPPRAPSPAGLDAAQSRRGCPRSGKQINYPAAQRGANEPPAPALPEPRVVDPTPTDRCARAPPRSAQGSAGVRCPIPPGSSCRVLGFHRLRPAQPRQNRRPLPAPVLF